MTLAAASPAAAVGFEDLESQVKEFTLPNGLKFVVLERPDAPVFSFRTYVDAGGVDELPGITGIAHMFEHMAFKGTTTIGSKDIDAELAKGGYCALAITQNETSTGVRQPIDNPGKPCQKIMAIHHHGGTCNGVHIKAGNGAGAFTAYRVERFHRGANPIIGVHRLPEIVVRDGVVQHVFQAGAGFSHDGRHVVPGTSGVQFDRQNHVHGVDRGHLFEDLASAVAKPFALQPHLQTAPHRQGKEADHDVGLPL